jgi:hypothetical protein
MQLGHEPGKGNWQDLGQGPQRRPGHFQGRSQNDQHTGCQYIVSVSRGWTQFASKSIATLFRPRRASKGTWYLRFRALHLRVSQNR